MAEPLARVGFGADFRFPSICAESGKFVADVDAMRAYAARGAQIVACDAARRLAVETLLAERAAEMVRRAA